MKSFNNFINESKEELIQYGNYPYKNPGQLRYFSIWDKKGVKSMYVNHINKTMESIYKPLGLWTEKVNQYGRKVYGISKLSFEEQSENWSKLNFVNSHYSALNLIVNWFNQKIYNGELGEKNQLIFSTIGDWTTEMNRLCKLITENKEELFYDRSSEIFKEITSFVGLTIKIGDQLEEDVIRVLSREQEHASNFRTLEKGDSRDLFYGEDVLFDYKGSTYIIQVKPTSSVYKKEDVYIIEGTSNPKVYPMSIHYYAFCNRRNNMIYLFRNSESVTLDGTSYTFPITSYVNEYKNN